MKMVAAYAGVATPPFLVAETAFEIAQAAERLHFPLFVKPYASGDSQGIDPHSLVENATVLQHKAERIIQDFEKALIEEYIPGREFTVLVCAAPHVDGEPQALIPVEFRFPPGESFKTYDLKVTQYTNPGMQRPLYRPPR